MNDPQHTPSMQQSRRVAGERARRSQPAAIAKECTGLGARVQALTSADSGPWPSPLDSHFSRPQTRDFSLFKISHLKN